MPEPLWTSAEIAAATGGIAHGHFAADGVEIDSRHLQPGDLFVALSGARDGHNFVPGALASGAAGALVSRLVEGPSVVVPDVLKALEALGICARSRSSALRGAVTGSVGKTSVTQAIAAGLSLAGRSHASIKSFNNHIGVPLTLARMKRGTERAVFEIGMNHAGEIEPLSRMVSPHAVAITTVGPVHIENFPDGEQGIAKAKAEIFAGLQKGGVAVLNADDRWFGFLKTHAEQAGAKVLSFGRSESANARLLNFSVHPREGGDPGGVSDSAHVQLGSPPSQGESAVVEAVIHGKRIQIELLQTGAHWGANSLCTLLMLEALDVPHEAALQALAHFAPLAGRGAESRINGPKGAFTLIDESYNANPISMNAAFTTLGARSGQRRIVALTDMLELGSETDSFHAGLAQPIEAADIDLVFCAGPAMAALWEALPSTRRGGYALEAAALAPMVTGAVGAGDLVMVKGSNGSKAGVIANALRALAGAQV